MAETPCQKCKRERDELALKVAGLEAQLREESELTSALKLKERVADLERGLGSAVERLGEFLQAFEGAPDPSENDTKRLVARLEDVLHNAG